MPLEAPVPARRPHDPAPACAAPSGRARLPPSAADAPTRAATRGPGGGPDLGDARAPLHGGPPTGRAGGRGRGSARSNGSQPSGRSGGGRRRRAARDRAPPLVPGAPPLGRSLDQLIVRTGVARWSGRQAATPPLARPAGRRRRSARSPPTPPPRSAPRPAAPQLVARGTHPAWPTRERPVDPERAVLRRTPVDLVAARSIRLRPPGRSRTRCRPHYPLHPNAPRAAATARDPSPSPFPLCGRTSQRRPDAPDLRRPPRLATRRPTPPYPLPSPPPPPSLASPLPSASPCRDPLPPHPSAGPAAQPVVDAGRSRSCTTAGPGGRRRWVDRSTG